MKLRDTLERLFWTFISAFLSTLLASPVLVALVEAISTTPATIEISPLGYAIVAAAVAGLTAVANAVLIIARYRLSVLPNPGDGLPALEVHEVPPIG